MAIHVNISQRAQYGDIKLDRRAFRAFLHLRYSLAQLRNADLRLGQKSHACLRQVTAACRAADQCDADRFLKLLHLHAERRLRDVRLLRGK